MYGNGTCFILKHYSKLLLLFSKMDPLSSSFHPTKNLQTKISTTLIQHHSSSLHRIIYISSKDTKDKPPTTILPTPKPMILPKFPMIPSTKFQKSSYVAKTSHPKNNPLPKNTSSTQKQPPPPHKHSLTTKFLNTIEDVINKVIDPPPIGSSIDPKTVLSDNFAPVEELPPLECEIEYGAFPSCLNGAYIRNGPNPQFIPQGPYHLFDGDGMLHSIRISNGKATFCSRYVKTYKYNIEHKTGYSILPNFFSGFSGLIGFLARCSLFISRLITGKFNPMSNGMGLANTSIALFGNKLYALGESDLPYEVKLAQNGNIETIGRNDFNGKLLMRMTAHPKVDPTTGETFAIRYDLVRPYLTYFRFDCNGNKHEDVPIFSMSSPSFTHDFAITNKYAIFPDVQFMFNLPETLIKGGLIVGFHPKKVSRLGVISRYANDEKDIRWFNMPGFNVLHVINAWDEVDEDGNEDAIVMVAPNIISAEHALERMHLGYALVERIRIDLKTGVVTRKPLSIRNLDFGVINPKYVGKRNKYVYAAIGAPFPKIMGVVKLDLSKENECVVATRVFGEGCYGGEPFFVAINPDDPNADEDDGYLVLYVHNENTNKSKFIVLDAKSPNLDVIVSVKLPKRVPYGFHGLFVRDKDLNMQDY